MNIYTLKKIMLLLAVLSLLLACVLPDLSVPAIPSPTSNPGLIQTIVVATAGAAQTQTAGVLPSPTSTWTATLAPSFTPTDTPTATATVIFIIPTATRTPTATLEFGTQPPGASCRLVAQSPANDTVYDPGERFNAEWTIQNTGRDTWQSSSIDFSHTGGRDMHDSDVVDLSRNVRADAQVTLEVDMRAPGEPGTYTSEWTLGSPKASLCRVSVRIIVQ